jgi:hypothetical protein
VTAYKIAKVENMKFSTNGKIGKLICPFSCKTDLTKARGAVCIAFNRHLNDLPIILEPFFYRIVANSRCSMLSCLHRCRPTPSGGACYCPEGRMLDPANRRACIGALMNYLKPLFPNSPQTNFHIFSKTSMNAKCGTSAIKPARIRWARTHVNVSPIIHCIVAVNARISIVS